MLNSETIYLIGLFLIGFSVVSAATVVPILLSSRNRLRNQLEKDYGRDSNIAH